MLKTTDGPTTVAILGGNPVVGKAVESLLRASDYAARFFSKLLIESDEPLGGARVALILPAPSYRHRESLITLIKSTPATASLPILELVASPNEEQNGRGIPVPWPRSIEDLERSIEAVLPKGSKTGEREALPS
jgi:hypothetical protein